MICGYYLYFTSHCVIEAMHVHASDRRMTEAGSAKLFVRGNGDTEVKERGMLTDKDSVLSENLSKKTIRKCT